ncbi:MAG: nitroreductase family protein [Oscillospiraceae bacterium]|nr:nitroreductase family protein [Oscillospiraceae bacterium]
MELIDTIRKRRSIRRYTDDTIPEETLDRILRAGLLAPTSRGLKPCEFYVVKDKNVLEKLSRAKKAGAGMLSGCHAAVVVLGDSEKADTWVEDCSIALSFMMLSAVEQGIGNCWVQIHLRSDANGRDAEQNVREILSVPQKYRVAGILSLGIPAEHPELHTMEEADLRRVHTI